MKFLVESRRRLSLLAQQCAEAFDDEKTKNSYSDEKVATVSNEDMSSKSFLSEGRRRFSLLTQQCRVVSDAQAMDVDGNGTVSKEELAQYIEKKAKLWAMLSVNLNLPEEKCREIATDVAYDCAKHRNWNTSSGFIWSHDVIPTEVGKWREPSVSEVQTFLDLLNQPKGEQEFFHRTVFAAFDQDGNGHLDHDELDKFLDVFYEAGSIFAGDLRLPPKDILKQKVFNEFDVNGDGKLDFYEIRSLISGGAQSLTTAQ